MNSEKIILIELRNELIEQYKKYSNEVNLYIHWTDAVCADFAEHISETIKFAFTEEQLYRQDNKVSETTIQRIVNEQFELKEKLHWTTRRVLDNLCIFLGYKNWNDFYNKKIKKVAYMYLVNDQESIVKRPHDYTREESAEHDVFLEKLQKAKQAEFEIYKKVPTENFESLEEYYDTDGLEYARILRHIDRMNYSGLIMDKRNNTSRFSIDSLIVLDIEGTKALATREYWHLVWCDMLMNYKYYFSLVTLQIIILSADYRIHTIDYLPTCKRDDEYVKRIYNDQTALGMDDLFMGRS